MAKKKERKVIAPQPGMQERAMNLKVDFMVLGGGAGSGKTRTILMHPLQYVRDPNFNAIYFRRVTTQITGQGGLWDEATKLYQDFNVRSKTKPQLTKTFPSGAKFQFMHMQHEDDKYAFQGLQFSAILFDEIQHFSASQVMYMMSRLRSDAESDSYMIGTCNPDNSSWLLKWVEWYLDEEGIPDPDKQGIVRYFVVVNDEPVFASSPEELKEQYPDHCKVFNPLEEQWVEVEPKSFTFCNGTIWDNPALIASNPKYLAELNSLQGVERARLLLGSWYARAESSGYFKREWLKKADRLPNGCKEYRGWDKASSIPSEENRYPDFTASIKIAKDREGYYYIFGGWHPECKNEKSDVHGIFQRRPGERDRLILKQAEYDGEDCVVVLPQDPGQAGASEFTEASKQLTSEGFVVQKDPSGSNKSKLKKFEPFSSACENGLVFVVESSFPNKATLEAFYRQLEGFDGKPSTASKKDD